MKKDNIIGLIGGMGPYASSYFYKLLLDKSGKKYRAINNDEFPEIVIDSVPVPDFISDTKQLDVAKNILISRTKRLDDFGCNIIAMVCNTGHILYPDLARNSKANFVSLINVVSDKVKDLKMKRVGLFATKITIKTGLYQQALSNSQIQIFLPDEKTQEFHEKIIRDVVANGETSRYKDELLEMTQKFINEQSLDGVILGCTELPLVFPKDKFSNVIDCLDVLADSLLTNYYHK